MLVDRHLRPLIGFFRYLEVPAPFIDDLVQETFEKALKSLANAGSFRSFSSWLMTIGRNAWIDLCRKHQRERDLFPPVSDPPMSGPPASRPDAIVLENLSAGEILERLSEPERFLVEMRIIQGHSFAEIAALTGEKEVTVRSRFFRLMRRLREHVEREDRHE